MHSRGGRIAQWIAYLLLAQRPRVQFSAFPRFFQGLFLSLGIILDVVEIYRRHALLRQWTVQSLIVDRTHPVLVRAVLQKKCTHRSDESFKLIGQPQILREYTYKCCIRTHQNCFSLVRESDPRPARRSSWSATSATSSPTGWSAWTRARPWPGPSGRACRTWRPPLKPASMFRR